MGQERERATYERGLRVRKRREYLEIQSRGCKRHAAHFIVIATEPLPRATSRLGITVSRRVGSSVERNHVKRRVREFFRRNHRRLDPPVVAVVVAKAGAAALSQSAIDRELGAAFGL